MRLFLTFAGTLYKTLLSPLFISVYPVKSPYIQGDFLFFVWFVPSFFQLPRLEILPQIFWLKQKQCDKLPHLPNTNPPVALKLLGSAFRPVSVEDRTLLSKVGLHCPLHTSAPGSSKNVLLQSGLFFKCSIINFPSSLSHSQSKNL